MTRCPVCVELIFSPGRRLLVSVLFGWAFTQAIAPGSFVVVSVGSGDSQTGGKLAPEYKAGTLYSHSPAQIAGFFDGLEFVGPGLVDARDWNPGLTAAPPLTGAAAITIPP